MNNELMSTVQLERNQEKLNICFKFVLRNNISIRTRMRDMCIKNRVTRVQNMTHESPLFIDLDFIYIIINFLFLPIVLPEY